MSLTPEQRDFIQALRDYPEFGDWEELLQGAEMIKEGIFLEASLQIEPCPHVNFFSLVTDEAADILESYFEKKNEEAQEYEIQNRIAWRER